MYSSKGHTLEWCTNLETIWNESSSHRIIPILCSYIPLKTRKTQRFASSLNLSSVLEACMSVSLILCRSFTSSNWNSFSSVYDSHQRQICINFEILQCAAFLFVYIQTECKKPFFKRFYFYSSKYHITFLRNIN